MASKHINLKLSETAVNNAFGLRLNKEGNIWNIGNVPAYFKDDSLLLENESYILTVGLMNLLTQARPECYTKSDLKTYREILLLTDAHRRKFNRNLPINAVSSWKYQNIISQLFPPTRKRDMSKRKQAKRIHHIKRQDRNGLSRNSNYSKEPETLQSIGTNPMAYYIKNNDKQEEFRYTPHKTSDSIDNEPSFNVNQANYIIQRIIMYEKYGREKNNYFETDIRELLQELKTMNAIGYMRTTNQSLYDKVLKYIPSM